MISVTTRRIDPMFDVFYVREINNVVHRFLFDSTDNETQAHTWGKILFIMYPDAIATEVVEA